MQPEPANEEIAKKLHEFFDEVVGPHLDQLVEDMPDGMELNSPEFAAGVLPGYMREVITRIAAGTGPYIERYYAWCEAAVRTYDNVCTEFDIPVKCSSKVARVIRVGSVCLIIHEVLPNYDVNAVEPISIDELEKRFIM